MDKIPFPSSYKKALQNKTKNVTIRVGKEIGKYIKGKIYTAESYTGRDWGVKIKITEAIPMRINKLKNLNIPKRSVDAILKREKVKLNSKAEVLKFNYEPDKIN